MTVLWPALLFSPFLALIPFGVKLYRLHDYDVGERGRVFMYRRNAMTQALIAWLDVWLLASIWMLYYVFRAQLWSTLTCSVVVLGMLVFALDQRRRWLRRMHAAEDEEIARIHVPDHIEEP